MSFFFAVKYNVIYLLTKYLIYAILILDTDLFGAEKGLLTNLSIKEDL